MANQQRQGTGRHGHKDTKEPWPHTQGAEKQQSQSRSSGERQQHQQHQPQQGGAGGRQHQQQQDAGSANRAEQDSLKSREYRDESGQVHHHTKTYMDQHGKDGGRQDR